MAQKREQEIAALQADFAAFQEQQKNPEALMADFNNFMASQQQPKQAAQIPSLADTQPKRDLQAEAREYFANVRKERAAQAAEENKRMVQQLTNQISGNALLSEESFKEQAQKKNVREDYQRQQQEENMLVSKKPSKADKWLSPNYKLTDEDKKEAKAYAQSELNNFNYDSFRKPVLKSAEERQHYADMVNLLNKSNSFTNFMEGYIQPALGLGNAVRDASIDLAMKTTNLGNSITDSLGITNGAVARNNKKIAAKEDFYRKNAENIKQADLNAQTQNPYGYKAGNLAGQVSLYALTNPAFDVLGKMAGLGKAGSFVLNQVGQNAQDFVINRIPMINEYKEDGFTPEEIKDIAKGMRNDAIGNAAFGAAGEVAGKLWNNHLAKKASDAAFRANAKEGAEKLAKLAGTEPAESVVESATKQAEEAIENIKNISKQIPNMENPLGDIAKGVEGADINISKAAKQDGLADNLLTEYTADFGKAAETVENAAKAQQNLVRPENLTPELQAEVENTTNFLVDYVDDLLTKAKNTGDDVLNQKADQLFEKMDNYINIIGKSNDPVEIKGANDDLRRALDQFFYRANKIDPEISKGVNTRNNRLGSYERMTGLLDDYYNVEKQAEKIQAFADAVKEKEGIDILADNNKVMAEDIGIDRPITPESDKLTIEIPDTPENAPTVPKPTQPRVNTPEGDDYISKFRTHNEQNFNLTDEELNNKYFNTQNENFHFLRGDRAGDLENATRNLETDYEGTLNRFLSKSPDTPYTPQEVDEGFMAWNKEIANARQTGDYGKSAEIMYNLTKDSHDKAQGLQAYVAWKKNSPAGVVLDATESARRIATDEFGSNYIHEIDSLTDQIDKICKGDSSLESKLTQIENIMKEAESKGYKKGLTGYEQMKDLLTSGSKIDVASIHDILCEANKVPNLSAEAQAEIGQIASEMYGRELTKSEKRKYINQINMILSKQKHWSIKDKAIELTHILMLSGLRTHEKNFVANVGMLPQEALARKISAIGQKGYQILGHRNYSPTQAIHVSKASKQLAEQLYEAKGGADAIVEGVAEKYTGKLADKIGANYMFGVGKENVLSKANRKATEKIPVLKKFEDVAADWGDKALKRMGSEGAYDAMDANASLLENYRQFIYGSLSGLEDNPFVKRNFVDRLASYIQAQGIKSLDDIPEEAIDIARTEALKATFKDDNAITELFSRIKKLPGVGELLLPFTKTPANLLARSIDFSPIGLARELYGAVNKNSRFARETVGETIDEISKGLGGTLTSLLGMYLYANGLITGKKSDNKDVANYMANEGWQEYSLSTKGIADFINARLGTDLDLGDTYYDFSFMQPSTTNIIAAEEVWDELMDGKKISEKTMDDIFNRAKSITGSYADALLAQSTMQNISELFGSQYSDDGVGENILQSALEWPTRFTSGAINDITKLGDDTRREYYSKNKPIDTVKNALMSKLPVLSDKLPAKYDVFGNEMTKNKSVGGRVVNTLFNPTSTSYRSDDPLYGYIDKLNDASEQGDYVPKKFDRKIKLDNEEELSLDNKQYSELTKVSGETRRKLLEEVQENALYKQLSADEQVNVLNAIEDVAKYNGYKAVADNAKVTDDVVKTAELYKNGGIKGVVDNYVSKSINKEYGLSSNSNVADEVAAKVASGDIKGARDLAELSSKSKEIRDKYGVSASSNAADKITAALEKGNTADAVKVAKEEEAYNKACEAAGIKEKNATTKKLYEDGDINGLKQYAKDQAMYEEHGITTSEEKEVFKNYGDQGLKTYKEFSSSYGLEDPRATEVYLDSQKGTDRKPSKSEFAAKYKNIDSLGNSNGHVDQDEFKSYLSAGNYTAAEAEELARIYGNWGTIPYVITRGKNKGKWGFH